MVHEGEDPPDGLGLLFAAGAAGRTLTTGFGFGGAGADTGRSLICGLGAVDSVRRAFGAGGAGTAFPTGLAVGGGAATGAIVGWGCSAGAVCAGGIWGETSAGVEAGAGAGVDVSAEGVAGAVLSSATRKGADGGGTGCATLLTGGFTSGVETVVAGLEK